MYPVLYFCFFFLSIPAGFIAMGGSYETLRESEKCIRDNLPLFIIDQTGGTSNILADMMKFAKKHNYDQNKMASLDFIADVGGLNFVDKKHILAAQDMVVIQEKVRVLLQSWPNDFNGASVLIIGKWVIYVYYTCLRITIILILMIMIMIMMILMYILPL